MIEDNLFEKEPDFFVSPDGQKYLAIRSIVYDSWIMWQETINH